MTDIFSPSITLLLFSVAIVFLLNIPYRFLMNQQEAANIKARSKELQERSKSARKDNPTLSAQLTRESLVESSKLTKLTMKPMMASLVIVILILPVLGNTYGDAVAVIKDGKGEMKLNGNTYTVETNGNNVKISGMDGQTTGRTDVRQSVIECAVPCRKNFQNALWNVVAEDNKITLQRIVALLPVSLPVFADDVGWLGWYFIVSIPFMMIFRKMLKINI